MLILFALICDLLGGLCKPYINGVVVCVWQDVLCVRWLVMAHNMVLTNGGMQDIHVVHDDDECSPHNEYTPSS